MATPKVLIKIKAMLGAMLDKKLCFERRQLKIC